MPIVIPSMQVLCIICMFWLHYLILGLPTRLSAKFQSNVVFTRLSESLAQRVLSFFMIATSFQRLNVPLRTCQFLNLSPLLLHISVIINFIFYVLTDLYKVFTLCVHQHSHSQRKVRAAVILCLSLSLSTFVLLFYTFCGKN